MSHYKIFSEERPCDMLLGPKGQHAGHLSDEPRNKLPLVSLHLSVSPLMVKLLHKHKPKAEGLRLR